MWTPGEADHVTRRRLLDATRWAGRRNARERHSKIAVTMEIYTEVPSGATRAALRKLGQWLGS